MILLNGAATPDSIYLDENIVNVSIGTLTTVDEDSQQNVTYTIQGSNNFVVVNGQLAVSKSESFINMVITNLNLYIIASQG